MIKYPKNLNKKELISYFKKNRLIGMLKLKTSEFTPDLNDLYRLHQFIILNKRTTVLEFGTGWSTLIIKHALSINEKKYKKRILELRRGSPFELFVVENKKKGR